MGNLCPRCEARELYYEYNGYMDSLKCKCNYTAYIDEKSEKISVETMEIYLNNQCYYIGYNHLEDETKITVQTDLGEYSEIFKIKGKLLNFPKVKQQELNNVLNYLNF